MIGALDAIFPPRRFIWPWRTETDTSLLSESAGFNVEGNKAVIVGLVQSNDLSWGGATRHERWTFVDNGEPGVASDLLNIEQLVADFGEPLFPYPGYDGVWKSWFYSSGPIPLAGGDIQVRNRD